MPVPDDKESAKLPLNDQESAKLAMSESAKKISDLKAKQWEIAKNAVIILAFLAAISRGELKYPQHWEWLRYFVPSLVFAYFCTIFQQASRNMGRYMTIYRKAAEKLFSADAFELYYQKDPDNLIEDEGRLSAFLFSVVAVLFLLVLFQIYVPSNKPTSAPAGTQTSARVVSRADSTTGEMRSSRS
ncbi:MAG TPA: hypothetical protein VN025_08135 [Candidatus Dormibacteraeota bacterium]|jgi:hypothetical protein|nr:hypothetical protein [Candidatus Dormibacteraeota bacterium]